LIDTNFDWTAEYYQWIQKNLSARLLKNGWTEIGTPFMDRHNDGLVIYAKRDGDNITLSDDGFIINDLLADGVSLRGAKRTGMLNRLLFSYGVENQDNEMVIRTDTKNYAASMHMFIQAMLTVNDMFMLNDSTVKTIFLDDVADYFDQQGLSWPREARGWNSILTFKLPEEPQRYSSIPSIQSIAATWPPSFSIGRT